VFVPPLPANVVELRTRITAAVAKVTPEMLRCKALFETPCISIHAGVSQVAPSLQAD